MTLDKFPDHIITRTSQSKASGLWYAVLNLPPNSRSWLDFSTCAPTEDEARNACAQRIRDDANGIGKYAPHQELTGYSLHHQLTPYWLSLMEQQS